MVAGIFALHGFWVGSYVHGTTANPKGHFENLPLKKIFKARYLNVPLQTGLLAAADATLKAEISTAIIKDGYTGGLWIFKCTVMYWPAFQVMQPHYVCVFRNDQSIFASNRATRMFGQFLSDTELRDNIKRQNKELHTLVKLGDAHPVYTDELIEGNYSSIEYALTERGVAFNREAVEEFIEPTLWRHGLTS